MNFRVSNRELSDQFTKDKEIDKWLKESYVLSEEKRIHISREISKRFASNFKKRWNSVSRKKSEFVKKYSSWLENIFEMDLSEYSTTDFETRNEGGRPKKEFEDSAPRNKRLKIKQLRESNTQALIDAASLKSDVGTAKLFDADSALALITQGKLSKFQYEIIRKSCKDIGHNIFPSYHKILDAKVQCYPENINVTESSAVVPLQDLLNHTAMRLVKSLPDIQKSEHINLSLHTKWGCDGTSGQSQYMQKLSTTEENISDSHMFLTSIVPLKITSQENVSAEIWNNPRPSSTNYCRPVQFSYKKESADIIREEKNRIENEIQNLSPTEIYLNEKLIKIHHVLYLTMIDGKVAQVVTDTSSSSNCTICGAKPTEMNCVSKLKSKQPNVAALRLGMSTLHCKIRFMEYLLHLGYNIEFKKWRTNEETRKIKQETKTKIQNDFKEKLGIHIDMVRQGTGNSNSGNTSRRFFQNTSLTSEILKIDKRLVDSIGVILEVITSNSVYIDPDKFDTYAKETAELAISLYPWYYMAATVHKILIHGKDIIENAVFPIGTFSEEAQESLNKDYKYIRCYHTRKMFRVQTNEDILHWMLISSDPFITYLRPEPELKILPLSDEAKNLLHE